MTSGIRRAALALLFASPLWAQASGGAEASRSFALSGATIHPVSGPDVPNGTLVVRDGKIASVSDSSSASTEMKPIDLKGKHVYPSLLPPLTVLGLAEIAAVRATIDTSEIGDVNPEASGDVAMNFDSELLPVARSGGVLLAGVTPTGGLVSGSVAAMRLEGWTREDAALKVPAAITVVWPSLTIDRTPKAKLSVRLQEKKRDEAVEKLKNVFRDARAYARSRDAEKQPGIPRHDVNPKLEALRPAVEGRIPVIVQAQRIAQIRDALKWAQEEKLEIAIWGGADAWRMADELAKAHVPVIVDSPLDLPQREDEPYDAAFANAGALAAAGVTVLFNEGGTPDGASLVRNYPHLAAVSVGFGFPREKALAAITLEPARLLGIADRVGSLEPGKDATFIVTDGDIFDLRSRVLAAYVDGRQLDLTDRQKRLYERYKARPKPQGAAISK
jgi:imidazolonepropionase-like amidohydrolase